MLSPNACLLFPPSLSVLGTPLPAQEQLRGKLFPIEALLLSHGIKMPIIKTANGKDKRDPLSKISQQ